MKTKTNLAAVVMAGILSIPAFAEVPTGVFEGRVIEKCVYNKSEEKTVGTQIYLHQTKSGSETVTYGFILNATSSPKGALYKVEEIDTDVLSWSQIIQRSDGILTLSNGGMPQFLSNVLRGKSKIQLKVKDAGGNSNCQNTGELTFAEADPVSSLPGALEIEGKNTQGLFKAGTYFGTLNLGDASNDSEDNYQVSESLPGVYALRKKSYQYDNPNKYVTERSITALALVRNKDGKKQVILMGAPGSVNSYADAVLVRQK